MRRYDPYVGILIGVFAASANAAELTVHIEHLKNETGNVRVGVFSSVEGYDNNAPVAGAVVPASTEEIMVTVPNLEAGDYIVALHHDENSNGELDMGWFGIPEEGYGFSNNPSARFGPPDLDKAYVAIDDGDSRDLRIQMRY